MKELSVVYRGFGASVVLGTLADDGTAVLFQYSPQAIEQRLELSPLRLPLRQPAYPDAPGQYRELHDVPGLVYDSLPDGWGYRLMHRRMREKGLDPEHLSTLDRLAYLGENTMGALVYVPPQADIESAQDLTLMTLAQEIQAVLNDDGYEVLAELARVGGSPGGARPKAQVFFNPLTGALSTRATQVPDGEPWLVKFAGDGDAADSCALEMLYARLAHACDLGMTATHLFELPAGLQAFGTQRFDRRGAARVHMHSLAGLLHANFQVPSVSYEDFFRATRRLTRDQRELVKAVRLCVFNVLMNNRDDHAKNISFLREADGRWRLAPPYDLTYCSGYRGEHFMDVAGEGKAPTRAHVLAAAQKAGLAPAVTRRVIDEVLECLTPSVMLAHAKALPLARSTVTTVHRAMKANHIRLAK
ncbi:MAG: type II toxin-antitoxin system HipA family toxin [Burkholderiaceae bacterium]